MSQTWNIPIDSTDTLSTSRTDINDALASLQTNFIGTADPAGGVLVDGLIWVNTTTNKLRGRISGSSTTLGDWAADLGHVRKDGTVTMTGALNMGSNAITNLAAPSGSNDAARKTDVDAKLAKAGDTLVADAILNYAGSITLPTNLALTHKGYCDLKVLKAGDTGITGRLDYANSLAAATAPSIMRKDEIEVMSFNTSTGHDHDGTDSKKVAATSLGTAGGGDATKVLVTDGSGVVTILKLTNSRLDTTTVDVEQTITQSVTTNYTIATGSLTAFCFVPLVKAGTDGGTVFIGPHTGSASYSINSIVLQAQGSGTSVVIGGRFTKIL